MESHLSIKYEPEAAHAADLQAFFEASGKGHLPGLRSAAKRLGAEAMAQLEELLDDTVLSGYLTQGPATTPATGTELHFTAGSDGLDFLVVLLNLIGPYSKTVHATWKHDEEPPTGGEYPIQLYWRNGRVENTAGDFIECADDVWSTFAD